MRSLKLLVLPALTAAALLAPAAAPAALTVGISENNPPMFNDPNFKALEVEQTRLVVAWNVTDAAVLGDNELSSRVTPYLAAAQANNVDVLVAFEHSRGAAEICKNDSSPSQCRLPSDADYERNLRAFLIAFPQVKTIAPFNEANHFTQPTSRNPKAAARFTDIATKVCAELNRGCTIVAVDVLDQADSAKAKKPKFKSTLRWIKTFKGALKSKLDVCGIHNYSDVNRFRDAGTKAIIKALKCKKYWLTETGGLYDFASFWNAKSRKAGKCSSAARCQVKALKYMFKIAKKQKKIQRLYVYTFFGGHTPRFDAGIVELRSDGSSEPRPAYNEVKKHTA